MFVNLKIDKVITYSDFNDSKTDKSYFTNEVIDPDKRKVLLKDIQNVLRNINSNSSKGVIGNYINFKYDSDGKQATTRF